MNFYKYLYVILLIGTITSCSSGSTSTSSTPPTQLSQYISSLKHVSTATLSVDANNQLTFMTSENTSPTLKAIEVDWFSDTKCSQQQLANTVRFVGPKEGLKLDMGAYTSTNTSNKMICDLYVSKISGGHGCQALLDDVMSKQIKSMNFKYIYQTGGSAHNTCMHNSDLGYETMANYSEGTIAPTPCTDSSSCTYSELQPTYSLASQWVGLIYFAGSFTNGSYVGYNGNLYQNALSMGAESSIITNGIEGADYICNNDPGIPTSPENVTYKAILVGSTRTVGIESSNNWVLLPNTLYTNEYNYANNIESYNETNSSATFDWNTNIPIIWNNNLATSNVPWSNGILMWTGLQYNWKATNYNCSSWTSNSNSSSNGAEVGIQQTPNSSGPLFTNVQVENGCLNCGRCASTSSSNINGLQKVIAGIMCVQQQESD